MQLRPFLLAAVVCCSPLLLSACGQSSESASSSKAPETKLSSQADQNLMPPTENQTSTVDVKTKNLVADQPKKPEGDEASTEVEKAEPEKTAIENEPKLPAKTGQELYATCSACHGDHGQGGVGPKLQGQSKETIIKKLIDFKAGKQAGPMSAMMIPNAQQLSDEDIKVVAAYIASF
ncbi:c-type cytochrome [Hydrogenovibrio kuenenii]|uniref:c-type cytochrome n=1 Tax=Hydrogenovibrio kuenenii TaxID=63658 RepID=UPI0004679A14|nr:c-type cytochrome [Hydrogenovibrio kuenenii]